MSDMKLSPRGTRRSLGPTTGEGEGRFPLRVVRWRTAVPDTFSHQTVLRLRIIREGPRPRQGRTSPSEERPGEQPGRFGRPEKGKKESAGRHLEEAQDHDGSGEPHGGVEE